MTKYFLMLAGLSLSLHAGVIEDGIAAAKKGGGNTVVYINATPKSTVKITQRFAPHAQARPGMVEGFPASDEIQPGNFSVVSPQEFPGLQGDAATATVEVSGDGAFTTRKISLYDLAGWSDKEHYYAVIVSKKSTPKWGGLRTATSFEVVTQRLD